MVSKIQKTPFAFCGYWFEIAATPLAIGPMWAFTKGYSLTGSVMRCKRDLGDTFTYRPTGNSTGSTAGLDGDDG